MMMMMMMMMNNIKVDMFEDTEWVEIKQRISIMLKGYMLLNFYSKGQKIRVKIA